MSQSQQPDPAQQSPTPEPQSASPSPSSAEQSSFGEPQGAASSEPTPSQQPEESSSGAAESGSVGGSPLGSAQQEASQAETSARPTEAEPGKLRRRIRVGYQAADLKAGLARPRPVHRPLPPTKKSEEPLPPKARPAQTTQPLESPQAAKPSSPPPAPPVAPSVPSGPRQVQMELPEAPTGPAAQVPLPKEAPELPEDLEREIEEALAGGSLNPQLVQTAGGELAQQDFKGRQRGRVVIISEEDVFVDLGRRYQGAVPRKQFGEKLPEVGQEIEVIVTGFDQEEGLYTLRLPSAGAEVENWSDLQPGTVVEVTVTGQNKGGLECKVGAIRGFIPISQVDLRRVEDLSPYVGQHLLCQVMEVNPQRRNLVLSHRAVLERQRLEARNRLLAELAPGQVRTGKVVRIENFGAFVDLGGVDALVPISRMSWARISHPRQLVSVGDQVQVRVEEVDTASGKVTVSMRDLMPNPWDEVATRYPPQSVVRGRVTRIVDYGAFVELEPGVEGLLHISEISHRRVWRVTDHLQEGQEIEVEVLSCDPQARRISLTRKPIERRAEEQARAQAEAQRQQEEEQRLAEQVQKKKPKRTQPLKGGLDRPPSGEVFGLKW